MLKKIILLFVILLIFFGCKKERNIIPVALLPNVIGNWALYSTTINGGPSGTITTYRANEYQCLAENILSINEDGTTKAYYTGKTTCFVDTNRGKQFVFAVGMPGQDTTNATWSSKADFFVLKYRYTGGVNYSYGKVTTVNGKEQLSLVDTLNFLGPIIYTNVFIKQ